MPTSIIFSTTSNDFASSVERVSIDENGDVNIKSGGEYAFGTKMQAVTMLDLEHMLMYTLVMPLRWVHPTNI